MRTSRSQRVPWVVVWMLALLAPVAAEELREGRWKAEARMGPESLTLVLDVARRDGRLDGRISVPNEHVLGLRLENFVATGDKLAFRIPHVDHPMDFSGRVGAELKIEGELALGGRRMPLAFAHAGATPAPPYREIEVSFDGEGRTVSGSLLLPPGDGPHPALAVFHATSTPGRDYQRFLADLAARAGFVALIYDRRVVPPDMALVTRTDFLAVVADAEAAVRFLRARTDVDLKHVGVGGLSQGAWISAIVATRVPEVAFVVGLSTPGVPLHEIDLYQSMRRLEAARVPASDLTEARELLTALFAASRGVAVDREALARRLESARANPWAAQLALPAELPPGGTAGALMRWSAHDLDPVTFFERLRVPVFLAFGERDERLPVEACATRLAESFERAGNRAVTTRRYPDANHALLGAPALEQDVTSWLRDRAGR